MEKIHDCQNNSNEEIYMKRTTLSRSTSAMKRVRPTSASWLLSRVLMASSALVLSSSSRTSTSPTAAEATWRCKMRTKSHYCVTVSLYKGKRQQTKQTPAYGGRRRNDLRRTRKATIRVPPPSISTQHRARDSIDPHHHAPAAIAITAYTLGFNMTTPHNTHLQHVPHLTAHLDPFDIHAARHMDLARIYHQLGTFHMLG